jgi:threonylcarbamoyladenosine tRNA methylthiotransferase MtaB
MKIYLDMVGCRLNQSELEIMARQLKAAGHTLVGDPAEADLAVVNTCTVTGAAAADSRKSIRRIARSGVENIITTGCWSSMHPDQALALPGVTGVVPNQEKDQLVSSIFSLDPEIFEKEPFERVPIPGSRQRTRAFIKAQDGCRHNCAYCITTIARGESRSQPPEIVVREILAAQRGGAREAVLTGVQLGSWGADLVPSRRLSDLVEHILEKTEIARIRLSSLEPWDVDQNLISLIRDDRVAHHLHLPLQSGSAGVMRRMARAITPRAFSRLLDQIRGVIPEIAITTDILTGFPGETEEEFEEGMKFIREMEFAAGHVFPFSPREGTPASSFPGQIPPSIRKDRSARLREGLAEDSRSYRERFLGRELKVLWEQSEQVTENTWQVSGLTDNYLRVDSVASEQVWNRFTQVRINGLIPKGVQGLILTTGV